MPSPASPPGASAHGPVDGDATLHALYRVAIEASRTRDPAAVARLALELAESLLGVDGAAVFAWDAATGVLHPIQETESSSHEPPVAPGEGAIGMAFESGQPVVVADYQTWGSRLDASAARGMVSAVAVPLMSEDKTFGALGVWTYQPHDFTTEQVELLQVLASHVAPALESARLVAKTEARSRIFEALHELAVAAGGGLHQVELADLAVNRVTDLLGVDGAGLYWVRANDLEPTLVAYNDRRRLGRGASRARADGAVTAAFRERRAVLVEDVQRAPDSGAAAKDLGVASMAAVPIVTRNQVRGVVTVWTYERRRFQPDEVQLLALFAGQVGPSIESAQLMEQSQAQAANFRILHDMAVAASGVLEPAVLAERTVRHARDLVGAADAALAWYDERSDKLILLADSDPGFPIGPDARGGVVRVAFESRQPFSVDDYQHWEGARPEVVDLGVKSVASVPMLVSDRLVGVLTVRSYSAVPFDKEKLQLLSLVAAQAAPALETARLVQERASQAQIFIALHDVAVAAGGVLEPEALAQLAVERAFMLLPIDSAGLYWWDPDAGVLNVLAETDIKGGRAQTIAPGEGVAGQAFIQVGPVVVDDYSNWEHASDAWREAGYTSGLGVPLLVSDRPVGAIGVLATKSNVFDAEAVKLLGLLAAQVAPALEAARLHTDLAASEERFRTLFETIACGVLVQGPGGEVLHANQVAEQVFGYSLDQMRGRSSTELWRLYREDGSEITADQRPAQMAIAAGPGSRSQTLQVGRHDGERRWLQVDSVPVRGARGGAVQVVSSFIDITELKRAEAALRESEQRFRAVFDRSAVGIVRVGLDARIMETNPALTRMFGYEAGELDGQKVGRFMLKADRHPLRLFAELGSRERDVVQLELQFRHKAGASIWTNVTASMVRDADGEPLFVIAMVEDISARKGNEAALAHQAMHDALTDLPNRVLLADRLDQAIKIGQRQNQPLALMFMDLDRFKEVNDTFGHHSGDALLQQVAARLLGRLRTSDTVARLGGDEFALVMPGIGDPAAAGQAATKILDSLDAPFTIEGEQVVIGASIGIALFPEHGSDADGLMRRADVAMYVAKRGSGGYSVYAPEKDLHTAGRLALQAQLREAIARGELTLHFQPKVSLPGGAVIGVEALARWNHPEKGLLTPGEFIPLAEAAGLVRPLAAWSLEAALVQARAWRDLGLEVPIAVNLSMRNLLDEELPEQVGLLLARHGVPPDLLHLEITESALMVDPRRSLGVLTKFSEMGVRFTIDDFGTGYSSLAHLRRLPISEIKIDRSFVTEMIQSESAAVIVRSVIDLGHNLGLQVVAEGVEDRATWDLLVAGGCDSAQGYLTGRPAPAGELLDLLRGKSVNLG